MKFTNDRLPNKGDRVYVTYGDNLTFVGTVKVYNPGTVVNTSGFLDVMVDDGTGDQIVLTLSTSRNFKVSVTEPSIEEKVAKLPIGARFYIDRDDREAEHHFVKVSEWSSVDIDDRGGVVDVYENSELDGDTFEVIE